MGRVGASALGALDGRVAVITGAGRGIGRAHALLFATEGARVVVNDLGAGTDGVGADETAAKAVVEEIVARGGEAVASAVDVTDWDGGRRLIDTAVDTFGRLDVLVNNAGFLRDRALVNIEEDDWDAIVAVHLKGHFVPSRWAATYWRAEAKAGREVRAALVHTSSTSGLLGNPGQTNYGAAKAGVASFSMICAQELARYGVRSNCIVPAARTRLTEATPGLAQMVAAPPDDTVFDVWDPANVAPVVAYLATAECPITGCTFFVQGGAIRLMEPWKMGPGIECERRWTVAELAGHLPRLIDV